MEIRKIVILTPQNGGFIVKKLDYEKEMSQENQSLPEAEQIKAHRAKEVCLPYNLDPETYIEIPE